MKINCVDKELKKVFESGYYKIPRFQRPYSWARENVEEFWNDAIVEHENSDYFIGSIVVYKSKDDIYGIVDGQQRFTTITMILCVIRNFLKEEGFEDLAKGVHNLVERKDINNKDQYIIQTETSYPYFQEVIQKFKKGNLKTNIKEKEEETALKDAFELINSNIRDIVDEIKNDNKISSKNKTKKISEKLEEVRNRILKLKLIFIELEDEDEAYIIFEILNTRGKDLRVSDLVKSYVTKLLKPSNSNVDLVKEKWNKMVELIEESSAELSFDSFLHHFWLSKYEYVTAKNLYKNLKKVVNSQNAETFLNELNESAEIYRQINETSYYKWQKSEQNIKRALGALNLFRVKQDLPMIISVMRSYRNKKLKPRQVEKILTAIENFHFMFTAVTSQRSSGGISFMYALSARDLEKEKTEAGRVKILDELIKKLRGKIPPYQEFESNFENIQYSSKISKQKKLVQYILEKIDRLNRKSGAVLNYEEMTIEHLASENPRKSSVKISTQNLSKIGNLILVDNSLNTELDNKTFEKKKEILLKSSLWIDDSIKKSKNWTESEINNRTKFLSKNSYDKVWKY